MQTREERSREKELECLKEKMEEHKKKNEENEREHRNINEKRKML